MKMTMQDKNNLWYILAAALMALLMMSAAGCRSVKVVTETHDVYVHDTTQLVDSVYKNQIRIMYLQGDTTYIRDSVYLYKYKYLNHDVNVYIHDSIPYEVEVEKVVHQRSGYDKFVSWGFWILLVLTILAIVIRVLIKIYLHK